MGRKASQIEGRGSAEGRRGDIEIVQATARSPVWLEKKVLGWGRGREQ